LQSEFLVFGVLVSFNRAIIRYRTFTKGDTGNPNLVAGFRLGPDNVNVLDEQITIVQNLLKKDQYSEDDIKAIQTKLNQFLSQMLNAK
jgi:hypothetical protein